MSSESASQEARTAGFKAALVSTASRMLALYFSRPIRLFRPSKISGWHTLRGQSLPLLIKQNGWIVIPRHFAPPLIVNALLGTVLWTTYSEASALLGSNTPSSLSPTAVAAVSGCCAGAVQALAAAPAENVRILLEGGRFRGSWSIAWMEVFAGAEPLSSHSPDLREIGRNRDEVRRVRRWVREVRGMAGRGWQGLGFGVAKDSCGFAVFFAIFDMSRRAAAQARAFSGHVSRTSSTTNEAKVRSPSVKAHLPRIVHSTTIVTGGLLAGLSYELVCRPFDVARRCLSISTVEGQHASARSVLVNKVREDGVMSFFRDPMASLGYSSSSSSSGAVYKWLRMLGRVGPWGVAFLAWENFGPERK